MKNRYEQHKEDLRRLKTMVRTYFPTDENGSNKTYNELFRGARYADGTYKKASVHGYTAYILGSRSRDDFYGDLKKLFSGVELSEDDQVYWDDVLARMEKGAYLQKQRTSDNGAIPHQLHLEEMKAIINRQKAYWPTLAEHGDKICQLLDFRLPYYVARWAARAIRGGASRSPGRCANRARKRRRFIRGTSTRSSTATPAPKRSSSI